MDLDLIDAERGGPMRVLEGGEVIVVPPASDLHWQVVATAVTNPHIFHAAVWPADAALTAWKLEIAHRGWVRHNGLPEGDQVRRLVYMMQRYSGGIEYDLRRHLGLSLGELWRNRRWRELLNLIDQLPTNSQMHALMTSDEEHMEALIRGSKGREAQPGAGRPSMAEWGQLESMVATLIDAVNKNTATNVAIANPKGPKPQIQPQPRPYTAAEKVQYKIQREEHQAMVSVLKPSRDAGTV